MDLGLKDRVYIVSGASRGLGHATAAQLVADGARVVLCSREESRAVAAARGPGRHRPGRRPRRRPGRPRGRRPPGGHRPRALRPARRHRDQRRRSPARAGRHGGGRDVAHRLRVRLPRPAAAGPRRPGHRRRPGRHVRAVVLGAQPHRRVWPSPTGCAPAWPWPPRPSPTSTARRGRGSTSCSPAGSTPTASASSTRPVVTRRPRAGGPRPASRWAATAPREEFGTVTAFVTSPAASYLSGTAISVDGGATRVL